MRFSSTFSHVIRELIVHMLTGVSKLSDCTICAFVLDDSKGMEIRACTDTSSSFGKIDLDQFTSFRVQSKANNIIAFEVSVQTILSAFKSTESAEEINFKLTKNKQGIICFTLTARTITQISVVQDVPIARMLPVFEMSRYHEPNFEPNATLLFPDIKSVKTVLERMKQLDKFVQIKADEKSGTLVFRVDTEVVSTRTVFTGLGTSAGNNQQEYGERVQVEEDINENVGAGATTTTTTTGKSRKHQHQFIVASLASKEFAQVASGLASFGKRTSSTVLAIVKGSAVVLHVTFDNDSSLTYYLATAAVEEDDHQTSLENNQLLRLETSLQNDDDHDL
jgi:hypothetical protein